MAVPSNSHCNRSLETSTVSARVGAPENFRRGPPAATLTAESTTGKAGYKSGIRMASVANIPTVIRICVVRIEESNIKNHLRHRIPREPPDPNHGGVGGIRTGVSPIDISHQAVSNQHVTTLSKPICIAHGWRIKAVPGGLAGVQDLGDLHVGLIDLVLYSAAVIVLVGQRRGEGTGSLIAVIIEQPLVLGCNLQSMLAITPLEGRADWSKQVWL